MRSILLFGSLAGCEEVEDLLLPDPPCRDLVEVDALTGRAELVYDASECVRDGPRVPTRVEYAALADRDWEPLRRPNADPCNTGSTNVLVMKVEPDVLAVDPTGDPAYPSGFVEGTWMQVTFWDHRSSGLGWSTFFRFGHPEDVVEQRDCAGGSGAR